MRKLLMLLFLFVSIQTMAREKLKSVLPKKSDGSEWTAEEFRMQMRNPTVMTQQERDLAIRSMADLSNEQILELPRKYPVAVERSTNNGIPVFKIRVPDGTGGTLIFTTQVVTPAIMADVIDRGALFRTESFGDSVLTSGIRNGSFEMFWRKYYYYNGVKEGTFVFKLNELGGLHDLSDEYLAEVALAGCGNPKHADNSRVVARQAGIDYMVDYQKAVQARDTVYIRDREVERGYYQSYSNQGWGNNWWGGGAMFSMGMNYGFYQPMWYQQPVYQCPQTQCCGSTTSVVNNTYNTYTPQKPTVRTGDRYHPARPTTVKDGPGGYSGYGNDNPGGTTGYGDGGNPTGNGGYGDGGRPTGTGGYGNATNNPGNRTVSLDGNNQVYTANRFERNGQADAYRPNQQTRYGNNATNASANNRRTISYQPQQETTTSRAQAHRGDNSYQGQVAGSQRASQQNARTYNNNVQPNTASRSQQRSMYSNVPEQRTQNAGNYRTSGGNRQVAQNRQPAMQQNQMPQQRSVQRSSGGYNTGGYRGNSSNGRSYGNGNRGYSGGGRTTMGRR